jgi:hypothetical protein
MYTMSTPMVYTMTTSIGAHIYTYYNHAHASGIDNDNFDRCTYIYTP